MNNFNNSFFTSRRWPYTVSVMLISLWFLPILSYNLLDHPPEYDELLHILAAKGILESGTPAIADGLYNRALPFSYIIADTINLPGDDLIQSRIPALVSGMLLVALVGGWVSNKAGWLAGLCAASVLALAPSTIHLSVLVRFYTLHAFIVTGMLFLFYDLLTPSRSGMFRVLGTISVALLFVAGLQLHVLTLISALSAMCAGFVLLLLDHYRNIISLIKNHKTISICLTLLSIVLIAYLESETGLLQRLRGHTPVWSVVRANSFGFYFNSLSAHMPFIWPIFPVLAVAGLLANRRLVLYSLIIITIAITINSIASQKATRYIYHFFPIICVVWGIGMQNVIKHATLKLSNKSHLRTNICFLIVLVILLSSFVNTQEFKRAGKLILGRGTLDKSIPVQMEPDWIAAKTALQPFINKADRVVATSGVKSLYAFGRYDYELNTTVVEETDSGEEFGYDRRTGKQVIGSAESVSAVLDIPGTEFIVLENRMLNEIYGNPADVVDVIESRCSLIPTPESSLLTAWICE